MASEVEYALMAGRIYQSARATINWLPDLLAQGWVESRYERIDSSGFEAVSFQKGSEIVISFAGTGSNVDWWANAGGFSGVTTEQLRQAADYYLRVKAVNPGTTISLTGHSLGGGLASLIAVFFDETAVTFDQAPFRNSASVSVATSLKEYLLNERGYSQAALQGLTSFISAAAGGGVPNNNNVIDFSVQGEILSAASGLRIGTLTSWTHGAPEVGSIDLHSHALLTAFLQIDRTAPGQRSFSDVTFKLPDVVRMIFDGNLYKFSTGTQNTQNANFIEHLVRHQNGIAGLTVGETIVLADDMLNRFTRDLWKLAQDGGLTMTDGPAPATNLVSKALIAFAMQMYYEDTANATNANKELFTNLATENTGSGGIRFDQADVAPSIRDAKGYNDFHFYLINNFSAADRQRIEDLLPVLRDWYVQAGSGGMDATDTQNRGAFMLGGYRADTLTGGTGTDLLVGNAGHDSLTGGAGTDTLMGGDGFDRYYYNTGDGNDRIEDADARGIIVVNGQVLVGGVKTANHTYWESPDGTIKYEMSGTDLVVKLDGTQIMTVNENFESGQFGIRLVEEGPFGEATRTDFLKFDHYEQVGTDPLTGDPIYEPVYTPFFDDTANDTRNYSLGGGLVAGALTQEIDDRNNLIHARGGNDFILSGAGDDQLYGEGGHDWIYGGLGNDRLFGGLGTDQLFGDNVAVSTSGGQDYLDGGEGDDFVGGGAGRDILFGGAGNDLLNGDEFAGDNSGGFDDWLDGGTGDDDLQGGAGSDVLIGGADHDFLLGDRTQYQDGTPEAGGNDVLDSGAGNDQLFGVYGNDVLIGGTGNDLLNGQDGNDVLDGGAGDDWLSGDLRLKTTGSWGTLGNSYVYDTDEYRAAGGDDVLFGEEGNDIIIGGEGSDTLDGGDGNDSLFGGYNTRVLSTSDPLYWTLFAAIGTDRLDAGAGSDMVVGGIGHDILMGGEGQDTLRGGGGDDVLEGGADNDVLYGEYAPGEFENNPYRAQIVALAGNNQLDGGAGNDELYGGDLADILVGGTGNDRLNGGSGVDILLGESGDDRILDDDSTSETVGESETLDGGDGNDYLESWWGDDTLLGGRGDDVLLSRAGTDSLIGGEGNDYLVWDNTTSSVTQVLYGGLGNDGYQINTAGAVVMEMAGEGIDLVISNEIGYVLPDTIENFMGSGFGNALDNVMMGWDLEGREGNDTLIGNGRLDGGVGDDLLQSGPAGFSGYNPENGTAAPPGLMSSLLQPTPHPKPTEPDWYLEQYYVNTAFAGYNNTYVFGVGYGHDTIDEMDRTFTSPFYQNEDTVEFLSGVAPSDIAWERIGNDLELSINGGADRLTIQSFYDLAFYHGNHNFSGLWVPPEGYEFEPWGYDVTSYPTYKAYSRVERFTFADGTVWTSDHFGAPQLGDYQADTYQFGRGSGAASVLDFDFLSRNNSEIYIDTIRIGAGVTPADIGVYKNGNDLILAIEGTDDYCTVQSFFSGVTITPPFGSSYYALPYHIEQVQFDDGTVWTVGDLYGRLNTSSDRFSTIIGTANADSLSGDSRDNIIQGLEGNDSLSGGGGHDALYGGSGNDYVQGGGGATSDDGGDYFEGGPGDDYILGYNGGNTYVFRRGDGQDRIGTVGSNGAADTLIFADLLPTDITVQQEQFLAGDRFVLTSNLSLTVNGSTDSVLLGQWVEWQDSDRPYNPEFELELIQFADGTVWTTADLIAQAQGVTQTGSAADESFGGSVFNDVLRGQDGHDVLYGEKGHDVLDGGTGDDVLVGGFGSDTYVFGRGYGEDWIDETLYWYPHWGTPKPPDVDGVQFTADVTPESVRLQADHEYNLVVRLIGTTDTLTIGNYFESERSEIEQMVFADGTVWDAAAIRVRATGMEIVGTESDDLLVGTLLSDVLMGLGGADILDGAEGNDLLLGGAGDDTYLWSYDGHDSLQDIATAEEPNHVQFLQGISASDLVLTAGAGMLTIGVDWSTGQMQLLEFDPTRVAGSLVVGRLDFLSGWSLSTAELLAGQYTDGDDVIIGTAGDDVLAGRAGADSLHGGLGDDILIGGPGNDIYRFELGDGVDAIDDDAREQNRLVFGTGITAEQLRLQVQGLILTLRIGDTGDAVKVAGFGGPTNPLSIRAFEFADGTVQTLSDLAANGFEILGTDGNDALYGTMLDDRLIGGRGDDYVEGQYGADTYVFNIGDGHDTIVDSNWSNLSSEANAIQFGPGIVSSDLTFLRDEGLVPMGEFLMQKADLLIRVGTNGDALSLANFLRGYRNVQAVAFSDGISIDITNILNTPIGTTAGDTITGTSGHDTIVGGGGSDALYGGGGNDTLVAGAGGTSTLSGGLGDDRLFGGSGQVTYLGGQGNDTMVSGSGGGTYVFSLGDGQDTVIITNNTSGNSLNVMQFAGGYDNYNPQLNLGSLVIRYGGMGDEVHIANFDPNNVFAPPAIQRFEFTDRTVTYAELIALGFDIAGTDGADVLSGTNTTDRISGLGGDDDLNSGDGTDTLMGGLGHDTVRGGAGDDTYVFNFGDGIDTVEDVAAPGEGNRIQFGVGISHTDLTFTRDDTARTLTIQVGGSGADQLVLAQFDPTGTNGSLVVGTLAFADGSTVSLVDLYPPNQAPTVAIPLADQTVPEDASVSLQVPAATFVDAGDVLTYSASLADGMALPSWLSFDPLTRTFIGMPDDVQVGSLDLRVTATDSSNLTASDVFTLTVTNVNEAPTVATPLADQNILEDDAFSLTVPMSTFADVDQIHGEVLTYSATLAEGTALPTWLSFDSLTRTFSGTPVNSDVGVLNVAVTATDSGNLSTSDTFSLTVQNINDAPTVAAPFADQTGAEDEPFSFTMPAGTFVDQDAILGDSLTYRAMLADGSLLPAWLSFNPLTRTFSGTPIPGSAGTVQLAVTATDTGTLSVSDQFALVLSGPLPKTFIGTVGNDVLIGARGDDTLLGLGGNDTLYGRAGHDWLDGGIGDDTMQGGMGDDTYVVNNSGDVVTELANEGIDTVRTSLTSYTLGANVENLTLRGGGTSLGVGNALNNTLLGDAGTNMLSGGGGDDVLIGGAGTDVLDGGAGADTLIGGIGSDVLVGGTGNDRYRFSRGDGQDVIRDKDTTTGNSDRLAFGATINPLDLVIERQANDLRLRIHGAGEDVLIASWYSAGSTNRIETIEVGNGQTLLSTQVDQLIQAMASFSQQTGLTWEQAIDQRPQDVQTVLAANGWQ